MTHHHTSPTAHDAEAITPACPIRCLRPVLSAVTYNCLTYAYGAPFDQPTTVTDVIALWRTNRLGQIWGLGPRRIGEIETALIYIGTPGDQETQTPTARKASADTDRQSELKHRRPRPA
jgi:hypothetical protein